VGAFSDAGIMDLKNMLMEMKTSVDTLTNVQKAKD
jgi:hypothetical protein